MYDYTTHSRNETQIATPHHKEKSTNVPNDILQSNLYQSLPATCPIRPNLTPRNHCMINRKFRTTYSGDHNATHIHTHTRHHPYQRACTSTIVARQESFLLLHPRKTTAIHSYWPVANTTKQNSPSSHIRSVVVSVV